MADLRKQGDFLQADFFDNVGGINTTDSPFRIRDTQAVAGGNYDYLATGGFRKRFGNTLLNPTPDSVLPTTGQSIYTNSSNTKTLLRATNSKLQVVNQTTGATTNVTDDTVSAGTSAFTSTQPVVSNQFDTAASQTMWLAGGGQASGVIIGYNGTKYTQNGAATYAGSITVASGGGGGTSLGTGNYYYAVVAFKASTSITSNASLDVLYSSTSGDYADVQLSGITAYDTTKYTQIWIYRSAISGSSEFTSGDLIAKIAYNGITYTVASGGGSIVSTSKYRDNGSYLSTSISVPRVGNTTLDNSSLPSGTYNVVTKYRRRLVTAANSTVYFSDLNKPESWPTSNTLTIPSGGPITALAIINFNTPSTNQTTEFLVVFKEREMWVITGSTFVTLTSGNILLQSPDIELLFVDYVGCPAQALAVNANGFLAWIDYRGIYIWDGSNKPIYTSRLIEYDFGQDGDFDLTKLTLGSGVFYRKQNEIIWFISSNTYGTNKLSIKMDVRLSLANIEEALSGRILEAVFIKDTLPYNVYGSVSTIISSSETLFASGNDGYIWKMYDNLNADNNTAVQFSYRTKPIDFSMPGTTKRYHKVIAWCLEGNLNNLSLSFWTNYRILDQYKTTQYEQITSQVSTAVWDQSTWDGSYWDQMSRTYNPVVFNLASPDMGTEGEAITLEFSQQDVASPVTIVGFSIIASVAGLRE